MEGIDWEDTCVGVATPEGDGAKTILRITGPHSHQIAQRILQLETQTAFGKTFSQRCLFFLDQWGRSLPVTLYSWPDRRSYTGQPSIELHWPLCSPPITAAVQSQILRCGARLARPGEFTLRAFLAGKLDLAQAEGVLGLIEAESLDELRHAIDQRAGGLSQPIAQIRGELLDLLADLEAGLDFVEEDISFISDEQLAASLQRHKQSLLQTLEGLQSRSLGGNLPKVVLSGPPNAGKSSLFNALAGQQHALVSPLAGTTRDHLSAVLTYDGVRFELIDTAGMELAQSEVDQRAQRQREQVLRTADIVLHCQPVDAADSPPALSRPYLTVRTKSDTKPGFEDSDCHAVVSVREPETVERLLRLLAATLQSTPTEISRSYAAISERCRQSLELAVACIEDALQIATQQAGHELAAVLIRDSLNHLGEIVGAVYTDDLLDKIFSKFCIGK